MRRPAPAVVAAAVVVVVLVAAALWWFRPFASVVAEDRVVVLSGRVGDDALARARSVDVVTPAGTVTIDVGRATDGLDGTDVAGSDDLQAPRGSELQPLSWSWEKNPQAPAGGDPTLSVTTADGARVGPVDLDGADGQGSVAVVADGPDDLRIGVGFDGVTQGVDAATGDVDAGVAEAYYADGYRPGAVPSCRWRADFPTGLRPVLQCYAEAASAPWRPGAGWVEVPGQRWLVVSLAVAAGPSRGSAPGRFLAVDGGIGLPTLDGEPPSVLQGEDLGRRRSTAREVDRAVWLLDEPPPTVTVTVQGALRLLEYDLADPVPREPVRDPRVPVEVRVRVGPAR